MFQDLNLWSGARQIDFQLKLQRKLLKHQDFHYHEAYYMRRDEVLLLLLVQ